MTDYKFQGVIMVLVGFETCAFGTITGDYTTGAVTVEVEPLLIIAFVLYLACAVLAAIMRLGELQNNIAADVCMIVMLVISGACSIAGVVVWGCLYDDVDPYAATLDMTGAALAFIGVIFFLLDAINAEPSTSGSGACCRRRRNIGPEPHHQEVDINAENPNMDLEQEQEQEQKGH